jgi:uncharacterized protein YndB with AHSA1/START domain
MKSEKSMPERSVIHNTFVIERNFPATVQRVFAAFSDPVKKRRWFAEGDEFKVESFDLDFRVGGHERSQFLVQGMVCTNDSVYLDIVPERRIVFAYTMTLGEKRISSSQSTVELLPTANGTDLVFTEQAAFFEGADGPQMRQDGWTKLLGNLEKEFTGESR